MSQKQEGLTEDEWDRIQEDCQEMIGYIPDYRKSNYQGIIKETDEYVIIRDGTGHTIADIVNRTGIDKYNEIYQRMVDEAKKRGVSTGFDKFTASDPIVVIKNYESDQ